ncbi:Aerotaxis receptor [compost metagenome]
MPRDTDVLLLLTDPQGLILHASPGFAALAGYEPTGLVGRPVNCLRHPDMPGGPFKDLWATLAKGQSWMGMLQNRRADGQSFWVDAYISPVLEDGRVLEYQAVYRQPTAQRIARAAEVYRTRAAGRQPAALRRPQLPQPLRATLCAGLAFLPTGALALHGAPQAGALSFAFALSLLLCWGLQHWQGRAFAALIADSRRRVQHPIKQLIYTGRTDETGQLQLANELLEARLEAVTARIHDSSQRVAQQAGQASRLILSGNQSSQEQLQALGEIAAAANEFTCTVQEVAGNTREAAELTGQAEGLVSNGHQRIDRSRNSIDRLSATLESSSRLVASLARQSHDIGHVLDVIRDIAEQTNLLALNAAIEAARAGENGRGFAVVADEVRSLAQRTHRSTEEVRSLIEALRHGTDEVVQAMDQGLQQSFAGVEEVKAAAAALSAILETVTQIAGLSAQIASATDQQGSAAEEINRKLHAVHLLSEQTTRQLDASLGMAAEVNGQAQRQQALIHHLRSG